MVVRYFLIVLCLRQTTENTVERETVIIGDNQAPVTQKATDRIDEELRLAIFKTLKLSRIFFSHFVRISEQGSKRHRRKSHSQLCWSIPHFIRALLVSFWFFFSDALFSPCFIFFLSWRVKLSDIFYLMKMKGASRSVVWNSQPHPYVQWCCACLPRVYVCKLHDESQQHRGLSNVWKLAYWITL